MVREDRGALVADRRNIEACTDELGETVGKKIAELRVRAVVNVVAAPESEQLAVFVGCEFDVHESRGSLAGVGDVLVHVEVQGDRVRFAELCRNAEETFVCRRELVAEGTAGVVLNHSQLIHGNTDAVSDHGHVEMDTDGFGVDGQHVIFIIVGIAVVRLDVKVRLSGAVGLYLDLLAFGNAVPIEVGTLDGVGLVVLVGNARMDLYRVRSESFGNGHVGGKDLEVQLDCFGSSSCMLFGIGCNYRDSVAVLEDLLIREDRTIPAVALVVERKHDKSVDPVLASGSDDVFSGDDLVYAGHLLGLRGVDAFDVGVGNFCLNESQSQRVGRHLQSFISAEVPGTSDFLRGGRSDICGSFDGVGILLEAELFDLLLSAHNGGSIHDSVDDGNIARAAAEVSGLVEPVSDFGSCRIRILVKQHLCAYYEARSAEAALGRAVSHPCHLQRMHILNSSDAFDRRDFCIVGELRDLGYASLGDLSVNDDVTGAAMSLSAADLAAGEEKIFSQNFCESLVPVQDQVLGYAIDYQWFSNHTLPSII